MKHQSTTNLVLKNYKELEWLIIISLRFINSSNASNNSRPAQNSKGYTANYINNAFDHDDNIKNM